MSLPRKQKPSPAEGELLFDLDPEPLEECLTAYAGIPLFVQAMRSLKISASVKQHVKLKQRQRGFDEATYVESFLVLNALGGDGLAGVYCEQQRQGDKALCCEGVTRGSRYYPRWVICS